jgi:hypothetical protein
MKSSLYFEKKLNIIIIFIKLINFLIVITIKLTFFK